MEVKLFHHWYNIITINIINFITLIYHSIDLYHSGKKIPLVLDYFNNILETLRSDDLNQITLAPNSNLRRYIFQVFFKKFFMDRIKQLHNMTSTLKRLLLWKCYTTIILCKSNSVTLLERLPTFLASNLFDVSCYMQTESPFHDLKLTHQYRHTGKTSLYI